MIGDPASLTAGEFGEVIRLEVAIEEMVGSDRVPDPQRLEASPRLTWQNLNQSEMALGSERPPPCA
jgi:hypothetical protein